MSDEYAHPFVAHVWSLDGSGMRIARPTLEDALSCAAHFCPRSHPNARVDDLESGASYNKHQIWWWENQPEFERLLSDMPPAEARP